MKALIYTDQKQKRLGVTRPTLRKKPRRVGTDLCFRYRGILITRYSSNQRPVGHGMPMGPESADFHQLENHIKNGITYAHHAGEFSESVEKSWESTGTVGICAVVFHGGVFYLLSFFRDFCEKRCGNNRTERSALRKYSKQCIAH